jgi:metal-responsive CopG/Arc/MetJ family transcriptional regulator
MKTAISIPDAVFKEAEAYARRTGKSRSQLYSEAMQEYLARRDPEGITEQMNRVLEAVEGMADETYQWSQAATEKIFRDTEW